MFPKKKIMKNWAYLKLTLRSTTCIITPVTKPWTFITVNTPVRSTFLQEAWVTASVATSTYAPTFIRLAFRFWN